MPEREHPVLYMTGGGPGTGKSSGILKNKEAHVPDPKQAAHADPDQTWHWLPEYKAAKDAKYR